MQTDAAQPRVALDEILRPIQDDLERMEVHLREILISHHPRIGELVDHVKGFRGKRLRPAMVLLAGRCVGEVTEAHLRVAAIVELIHTATLVHDDVLDEASVRRRLPTVNALHGNSPAVLLGDYLFASAFSASANLENRRASQYLSHVTGIVCQGEIQQILERGNLDLTEDRYFEIISAKTASLYAAAARVGAEYAGAEPDACEALASFGHEIGLAFQIADDCLDIAGDEERVGKSLGTDFHQAKMTLPIIHFLNTASESQALQMREYASSGNGALVDARRLIEDHGSLRYAEDRAALAIDTAKAHLAKLPPSEFRDALDLAADYVVYRRR